MSKYKNESLPISERLGQVGYNNQGEKITIIAYRNNKDIDVQFEDGVIVYNKNYGNFIKGKMKYPTKNRIGETAINNQGLKMTIIAYRVSTDVDIQFEDGVIAYNKDYYAFKKGLIAYPKENRIGETRLNNQGLKMTIIAYRSSRDIDVQFEDGVIVCNRAYNKFIRGRIAHPIRYEESFAHHIEVELGIDLDIIWNWEKNNENDINPYEISKCSEKKVWLYCQEKDYHNDFGGYEIQCNSFTNGNRCGYCFSRKVHSKDSFAQWGINNFGEDFLEKYWSSKNTLNPWEISKCSSKKVFLYCQEKDYHNYDKEGNKIGYEIRCSDFYNGRKCGYCGNNKVHWEDSLAHKHSQIARMISEVPQNNLTFEDCFNISCYSNKKFYFKCLDCNTISNKKYTLNQITTYGYSCKCCSDGISIPNKFSYFLLTQLNVNFKSEYSPYYFRSQQSVDFLLTDDNIILEMDGGFGNHTREYDYWRDFLNMKYGGYKTIRIDLTDNNRYTKDTLNYIKEQIINSELSELFELSDIDWKLIWEQCQSSLCVKAWELWDNGIHSTKKIAEILDLSQGTVINYLKRGAECGKCSYTIKGKDISKLHSKIDNKEVA